MVMVNKNATIFLNRRTQGGRKLWESKDDRKWGHDKFEELTLQERHYQEVMVFYMCNPHIYTGWSVYFTPST